MPSNGIQMAAFSLGAFGNGRIANHSSPQHLAKFLTRIPHESLRDMSVSVHVKLGSARRLDSVRLELLTQGTVFQQFGIAQASMSRLSLTLFYFGVCWWLLKRKVRFDVSVDGNLFMDLMFGDHPNGM